MVVFCYKSMYYLKFNDYSKHSSDILKSKKLSTYFINKGVNIKYDFTFTNGDDIFHKQFSADEFGKKDSRLVYLGKGRQE